MRQSKIQNPGGKSCGSLGHIFHFKLYFLASIRDEGIWVLLHGKKSGSFFAAFVVTLLCFESKGGGGAVACFGA
jgi:hypothetical protein